MQKRGAYHTPKDLTGQRFGRYTVLESAGYSVGKSRPRPMWSCLCDCGTQKIVRAQGLLSGNTVSCGCFHRDAARIRKTTHGESKTTANTPEYRAFNAAKERCQSPTSKDYPRWGEKGIQFLFDDYPQFLAEVGRRPTSRHSLDRFPNRKGHYAPGNVRWATPKQQGRNRSDNVYLTVKGESKCMSEWSELTGQHRSRIKLRHRKGWCDECTVLQPAYGHCIHR